MLRYIRRIFDQLHPPPQPPAPPPSPTPPAIRGPAPAAAKFLARATEWRDGTLRVEDVPPFSAALMNWWRNGRVKAKADIDPLLLSFIDACMSAHRAVDVEWHDRVLRMRDFCGCGSETSYRNAGFCTHCSATFCSFCCTGEGRQRWDNGNGVCPRCGRGELVV